MRALDTHNHRHPRERRPLYNHRHSRIPFRHSREGGNPETFQKLDNALSMTPSQRQNGYAKTSHDRVKRARRNENMTTEIGLNTLKVSQSVPSVPNCSIQRRVPCGHPQNSYKLPLSWAMKSGTKWDWEEKERDLGKSRSVPFVPNCPTKIGDCSDFVRSLDPRTATVIPSPRTTIRG